MFLQSIPSPAGPTRRRSRAPTRRWPGVVGLAAALVAVASAQAAEPDRALPRPANESGATLVDPQGVQIHEWSVNEVDERRVAWDDRQVELDEAPSWSSAVAGSTRKRVERQAVTEPAATSTATATATTSEATTDASTATSSATSTTATLSDSSASSAASSSTLTTSAATSTSTAVPAGYELPRAFDSTLGTNFSSTACPSFFSTFLADPDFIACAPLSLLLGTSTGFFQAQRAPYSLLPYVLDASCSAPQATCEATMDRYARQIKLQNTCGPDLAKGNLLAEEALDGFRNYRLYRDAGCQKDNSTDARYCLADASAAENPSALYFYYLPEGTNLPSGTSPDCGYCTKNLLSIYARYATNTTLTISKTYAAGRSVAALECGPEYAPLVTKATSAACRTSSHPPSTFALAVTILTLSVAVLLFSG
ncbi:hypothetical protein JCM10212_002705 [Sporobolomyces blumeae]